MLLDNLATQAIQAKLPTVLALQVDEKRIKYDVRLVATILWSAAVFEHFQTPVYKRMMGLLHTFDEYSIDKASKNHIREVGQASGSCLLC